MNELVKGDPLPPITPEQNQWFEDLIKQVGELPPVELRTEHHLHAGVYSRTIYVPAGTAVVGLTVRCPTQLVASGHFQLTDGDVTKELNGYYVLDGSAGRRAAVVALTDCAFTMLFATSAKTVEEAEAEFTDEPDRLLTRKEKMLCRERQLQERP